MVLGVCDKEGPPPPSLGPPNPTRRCLAGVRIGVAGIIQSRFIQGLYRDFMLATFFTCALKLREITASVKMAFAKENIS